MCSVCFSVGHFLVYLLHFRALWSWWISFLCSFTVIKLACSAGINVKSLECSSFQSLDQMARRGDMRDDSAEILFQSFLQETLMSSSGMGRDVHSLMLSIRHLSMAILLSARFCCRLSWERWLRPLHLLIPNLLGCCRLQLTSFSSMTVLQPPPLFEGWGGRPLCLSGDC